MPNIGVSISQHSLSIPQKDGLKIEKSMIFVPLGDETGGALPDIAPALAPVLGPVPTDPKAWQTVGA